MPQKRTSFSTIATSALRQKRTLDGLFNHLVGQLLQIQGHIEAERLRGLEVYHLLEFGGRLNRQLTWFLALEHAVDIRRRTPVLVGNIGAVRDQAADFPNRWWGHASEQLAQ